MPETDLGILSIVTVGPYKAITWQATEGGKRRLIGLDRSGTVVASAVDTIGTAAVVLRDSVRTRAAQAVAHDIASSYVDYLLSLPEDNRPPSFDLDDEGDLEALRDDVRNALTSALVETDAYQAAKAFEDGLGRDGFRPDIRLVHKLQGDQRDLLQEAIQRDLVGPVAHSIGKFLMSRSPSLKAAIAEHLPEAQRPPDDPATNP